MKKKRTLWYVAGVLVIAALAIWLLSGNKKKEEVSFESEKVEISNIQTSITATGTIEPVTSVTVGTQVSGIVSRLYVDYNSVVKKGQVIAELDKTNLTSELNTSKANLNSAQSSLNYQQANYNRYKTLYDKGLISADEFENARLTYQQAVQQVAQARENVKRAQTNLSYATITSPIDGVVLSKSVEEGQTVASSFNTPELFVIAKDLTDMRVIADIDEADIGGVKEGQRVSFTVDAFPEDTFNGTVQQVRQEATTESNVVTYEVVISARNNDLKLKPGLTANVTIFTMEKNQVLSVSSKALRFTPNAALLNKNQVINDCQGEHKLWTQDGDSFTAHAVEIGVTNGVVTEIISGIKAGTTVLTDFTVNGGNPDMPQDGQANNPFMPRPRNNRNNNGGNNNGGNNIRR